MGAHARFSPSSGKRYLSCPPSLRLEEQFEDEQSPYAAEAAKQAGYTDIYKQSLIGITEMEKLMGKKKFNEILGNYVYKPDGKVTLVPDSDKREAVKTSTAEADFKEE